MRQVFLQFPKHEPAYQQPKPPAPASALPAEVQEVVVSKKQIEPKEEVVTPREVKLTYPTKEPPPPAKIAEDVAKVAEEKPEINFVRVKTSIQDIYVHIPSTTAKAFEEKLLYEHWLEKALQPASPMTAPAGWITPVPDHMERYREIAEKALEREEELKKAEEERRPPEIEKISMPIPLSPKPWTPMPI